MMQDRICELSSSTEKARGVATAVAELMDCEALVNPRFMDSEKWHERSKAYEVLRNHDTCGSLILVLLDILNLIDKQIDAAAYEVQATKDGDAQ